MKLGDGPLALGELVDLTPEEKEPLPASMKNYVAYTRCMQDGVLLSSSSATGTHTKIVMTSWLLVRFSLVL